MKEIRNSVYIDHTIQNSTNKALSKPKCVLFSTLKRSKHTDFSKLFVWFLFCFLFTNFKLIHKKVSKPKLIVLKASANPLKR